MCSSAEPVSRSAASVVPAAPATASKVFFDLFDAEVMAAFDGRLDGGSGEGFTASLVSCDAQGWPVTALLGPGEILAIDRHRLIVALWPASRANRHLAATRQASLDFVLATRFYQLRLRVERSDDINGLTLHRMVLVEGETQTVPYASLTTGIRYTLDREEETIARWREQVTLMRDAAKKA